MAAVAPNELRQVPHVPLRPEIRVVSFGQLPHVECLVHHHHAHLVAEVEQSRRGRIVRGADRVAAHLLQQRQLSPRDVPVEGRADRPQVVVHAHAPHLAMDAVQEEAPCGIKLRHADAVAELLPEELELVQRRVLWRPEPRILHREREVRRAASPVERHRDACGRLRRLQCADKERVRLHMVRRANTHRHVAEDARPRVPAR